MNEVKTEELLAPRGQGGCMLPRKARAQECGGGCAGCGWNRAEHEMRQTLPLTMCEDGLRRKILPKRPELNELGN